MAHTRGFKGVKTHRFLCPGNTDIAERRTEKKNTADEGMKKSL
jgi:hypothetical protein